MAEELKVSRGEDDELLKINNSMFRACGFSQPDAEPQQSAYSLQDHLELDEIKNEQLESRLALAGPMLETRRNKNTSVRKQVSDGCVGVV